MADTAPDLATALRDALEDRLAVLTPDELVRLAGALQILSYGKDRERTKLALDLLAPLPPATGGTDGK
jgi:hypothetical protein